MHPHVRNVTPLLVLLAVLALPTPSSAATLTVNSVNDSMD